MVACLAFARMPVAHAAPTDDSCFTFNSGTGTISDYTVNPPLCPLDVEIPDQLGGVDVEYIASTAFESLGLTSVTFPANLVSIDDLAFDNNNLTSVSLPPTLQFIGEQVFNNNNLTSVVIPNSVTTIENGAFQRNQLTSVTLSSGLSILHMDVFAENQITSVTIPEGVTAIGESAFFENQISNLILPSTLLTIDSDAFATNNIETLSLPNSLASVGDRAFMQNKITSVVLPDSLVSLGQMVFVSQSSLGSDLLVEVMSGDPVRAQEALDKIWYVQLYSESPGNPNSYSDEIITETIIGMDVNGDSDMDDSMGGHIINPAHITVHYEDQDANAIASAQMFTGQGISSYLAIDNSSNDPTLYYRLGGSDIFTAPTIAGYVTPPSQAPTFVLGANTVTFTYTNAGASDGSGGDSSGSAEAAGGLADTGTNARLGLVISGLVIMATAILFVRRRQTAYRLR